MHRLKRTRLGESLVQDGVITPNQLHTVLKEQKDTSIPLGELLVRKHLITRRQLKSVLFRQAVLRGVTAALFLSVSLGPVGKKNAKADVIRDVPSKLSISTGLSAEFAKMASYPSLFGSEEKASRNLSAFTKWTDMFDRFERGINSGKNNALINSWKQDVAQFSNRSLDEMANGVNNLVNKTKYIIDSKNWGKSDYWATPIEFMKRGGDCEDFAIAKYVALRALGVPEERLRVAIVHDKEKNIPHAILVVYTDKGALILDNQIKTVQRASTLNRYRPIFSINRQAWWLHSAPQKTIIASAN